MGLVQEFLSDEIGCAYTSGPGDMLTLPETVVANLLHERAKLRIVRKELSKRLGTMRTMFQDARLHRTTYDQNNESVYVIAHDCGIWSLAEHEAFAPVPGEVRTQALHDVLVERTDAVGRRTDVSSS